MHHKTYYFKKDKATKEKENYETITETHLTSQEVVYKIVSKEIVTDDSYTNILKTNYNDYYIADIHYSELLKNYGLKRISNESNIYKESTTSAKKKVKPVHWPPINTDHLYSNRQHTKSYNYHSSEGEYKKSIPNQAREINTFTIPKYHSKKTSKGPRKSCYFKRKNYYENNVYYKSTEQPEHDKYFEQKTKDWDVKNIADKIQKKNWPELQNKKKYSHIFTHYKSEQCNGEFINGRENLSAETKKALETDEKSYKNQTMEFKNNLIEVKGSDMIYLPVILVDTEYEKSDVQNIYKDIQNRPVNVQALAALNLQNENISYKIPENTYNQRTQTTHLEMVVSQEKKNRIEPDHRPETSWVDKDENAFSKSIMKNTEEENRMNQTDACKTNKDPISFESDINTMTNTKEELSSRKIKDASSDILHKIAFGGIGATFKNYYPVTKDYIQVNNTKLGKGRAIIMKPRKTHEEKRKTNKKHPKEGFITSDKIISHNTVYNKLVSRKSFIKKIPTSHNNFSKRHGPEKNTFKIEKKQGSTVIENSLQQEIGLKVKSTSGIINLSAINKNAIQELKKVKNNKAELNPSNKANFQERNRIVPIKEVVLDQEIETSSDSVTINRKSNIYQKLPQANLLRGNFQKSKLCMKIMPLQQQKAKLIFKGWRLPRTSSDQHYVQTKAIDQNKMTIVYEGIGEASSGAVGKGIKNEFMRGAKVLVLPKERKSTITGKKAVEEFTNQRVIKSVVKENIQRTDLEGEKNTSRKQIARVNATEIFYKNSTQMMESDKELSLLNTQEVSSKIDKTVSKMYIYDKIAYRKTLSIPLCKEIDKKVSSEITIKDSIITENIHIPEVLEKESILKKCNKNKCKAEITWNNNNAKFSKNCMSLQSSISTKGSNKFSTKSENIELNIQDVVNLPYKERILTIKWKETLNNAASETMIQVSDIVKNAQICEIDKKESLLKHIEKKGVAEIAQNIYGKSKSNTYLSCTVLKEQSNKNSSLNNKNILDSPKCVDITYQETVVVPAENETDSKFLSEVTVKCSDVVENLQENELKRKQCLINHVISKQSVAETIQNNRESSLGVDLTFSDLEDRNIRDSDRSEERILQMQEDVDMQYKQNNGEDKHSSNNKGKIKTFSGDTTIVQLLELDKNAIYMIKPKGEIPFNEFLLLNIVENKPTFTKSYAPENIYLSSNALSTARIMKEQKNNHSVFIQRIDPVSTMYKDEQHKDKLITMYENNKDKVEAKRHKLSKKFVHSKLEITPPYRSSSRLFKPLSRNKTQLGKYKLIKETDYDHTQMYMPRYQRNVWGYFGQPDSKKVEDKGEVPTIISQNGDPQAQISTKITDEGKKLSNSCKYIDKNRVEKLTEINKIEQFTEEYIKEQPSNTNEEDEIIETNKSCKCIFETVKQAKECSNFLLGTTLYQQLIQLKDLC